MQDLKIVVTLETAQAVQAGNDVAAVIEKLHESALAAGVPVAKLEKAVGGLTTAETAAATATDKHAQAAKDAAPAVDKQADAAAKAAKEADKLAEAEKKAAEQARHLAEAASDVSEDTALATLGMGNMAKAGDDLAAGAKKASGGVDPLANMVGQLGHVLGGAKTEAQALADNLASAGTSGGKATKGLTDAGKAADGTKDKAMGAGYAFDLLTRSAGVFGLSLGGFEIAGKFIEKMREDAEAAAKAIVALGGNNRDYDMKIKETIDNLFPDMPGDAGRLRARKIVSGVQVASGANPETAAALLAGAQGAGYKVADANDPASDGNLPGVSLVQEVAKYASRVNLDKETSGQLFKLLKQERVGNAEEARKVIAMFEAGAANTAENNPAAYTRALLGVSLGQKPGELPQMMGMLSAAGINTDSSAKARERVDALNQASAGTSAKLGATGAIALQQGYLSAESVAFATPTSTKEAGFVREEAALNDRDRNAGRETRQAQDRLAQAQIDLANKKAALDAYPTSKAYTNIKDPAAQARKLAEEKSAYDRAALAVKQQAEDLAANPKSTAAARAALAEKRAADVAERRDKGLAAAYAALPTSEQQRFFRENLIGKSDAERKAFAQATMETGERQEYVVRFTGQTGADAYKATVDAAKAAKPEAVAKRNQEALSGNEIGRANVQDARIQQSQLSIPGASYAADMKKFVEEDLKQLRSETAGGAVG